MNEFDVNIEAKPVRLVPLDLGAPIDDVLHRKLSDSLGKYPISITERELSLLVGSVAVRLSPTCRIFMFKTGICVAVIEEQSINFDKYGFEVEYCTDRKTTHHSLYGWEHRDSAIIMEVVTDLRRIVHEYYEERMMKDKIRISGNSDFENQGMSYVFTLSLFYIQNWNKRWDLMDDSLKRSILALLDPAILHLEDSADLGHKSRSRDLSNMDLSIPPKDYENRVNISTYMSWSSVLVFGDISEEDHSDYVSMEIDIQSKWYYTYCIERDAPSTFESAKERNYSSAVISTKMNESKMVLENLTYKGSKLPSRFSAIQKGMVDTSKLIDNYRIYKRKMDFFSEMFLFEEEEARKVRRRRYALANEFFLLVIALIQMFSILFGLLNSGGTFSSILISLGAVGLVAVAWGYYTYMKGTVE